MARNDESEIRRLAHKAIGRECLYGNHLATCDRIAYAIRTALAAEREQHARDVAKARADAWRAAVDRLEERAREWEGCAVSLEANGDTDHQTAVWRRGGGRALREMAQTLSRLEARAQALNAPPQSPASPTGETRDERRIADQVDRWAAALRRAHWNEDDALKPWDEFVRKSNENDGSDAELWRRLARAALREFDNDPDDTMPPASAPSEDKETR